MLTGKGLIEYGMKYLGQPYMYGVNCWEITEELIRRKTLQYPPNYSQYKIDWLMGFARENLTLPADKKILGVQCNSFACNYLGYETTANGWLARCTEKGSIDTIPEVAGVIVHRLGHMGYYLTGGRVLEARAGSITGGTRKVMITTLDTRGWTSWGKLPGVNYEEDDMIYCKRGDKTANVLAMQQGFVRLGIAMINNGTAYTADGSYGQATSNAVAKFKADNGLSGDGDTFDADCVRVLFGLLDELSGDLQTDLTAMQTDLAAAKTSAEKLKQELDETSLISETRRQKLKAYSQAVSAMLDVQDDY